MKFQNFYAMHLGMLKRIAGQGRVTDYIPALADVYPSKFGMAVALPNGEYYCIGDAEQPFTISKPEGDNSEKVIWSCAARRSFAGTGRRRD